MENRTANRLEINGLTFAAALAGVAANHKTENIVVLDLRGLSGLADYFVIGTGTSDRQMHAVLAAMSDYAHSVGRPPYKVADAREVSWILADFVDVIVHLFDARSREYYDLEGLWGDAPRIDVSSVVNGVG